jgi:hypothetical protein
VVTRWQTVDGAILYPPVTTLDTESLGPTAIALGEVAVYWADLDGSIMKVAK